MKATAFSPHEGLYIQHLKTSQKNNMPVQHYHDAYEIYLQLDGKRYLFYDNICHTLERGDMAVFKPFDIHYAESRESDYYERYVLNFQTDTLASILTSSEIYLLTEKIKTCVIHLNEEQINELFGYFERAGEYADKEGFLMHKMLCSSVFQLIIKAVEYTDKSMDIEGEKIAPQIITALRYINKHYAENISLDDISAAAYMSKFYFCRKFHSTTGATALEYLNNIRLTKVHSLLLNTNMTIDEIACETGFMSAINLTRAFKKVYGSAPREFRKLKKEN